LILIELLATLTFGIYNMKINERNNPEHLQIVNEEMNKMLNGNGPGQPGNISGINPKTKLNPPVAALHNITKYNEEQIKLLGQMGQAQ